MMIYQPQRYIKKPRFELPSTPVMGLRSICPKLRAKREDLRVARHLTFLCFYTAVRKSANFNLQT